MNLNLSISRRVALVVAALVVAALAVLVARHYFAPPEATTGRSFLPTIGGPFTLTDQDGQMVPSSAFDGKLRLIYFGYTFCPDVCPTALTVMADALELLGDDAKEMVPIFITVDPKRDTPDQLAMYVRHFHPRLIGLTGTPEEIAKVAKAYRVYYAKAGDGGTDADDYLMDHTSIVYLMGRDGNFLVHFGSETSAETMAKRIRQYL